VAIKEVKRKTLSQFFLRNHKDLWDLQGIYSGFIVDNKFLVTKKSLCLFCDKDEDNNANFSPAAIRADTLKTVFLFS
jgi:hypothetical protein